MEAVAGPELVGVAQPPPRRLQETGLLELSKQFDNVSQACKIMGYSRDSFY